MGISSQHPHCSSQPSVTLLLRGSDALFRLPLALLTHSTQTVCVGKTLITKLGKKITATKNSSKNQPCKMGRKQPKMPLLEMNSFLILHSRGRLSVPFLSATTVIPDWDNSMKHIGLCVGFTVTS